MKGLAEREKAFEAEFKRNQELAFPTTARRSRLFGLWAAARLGLPQGETAEAYAKTVVAADFKEPRDDDVIQKVQTDLAGKNINVTEAELRAELAHGRRSPPATLSILKRTLGMNRREGQGTPC